MNLGFGPQMINRKEVPMRLVRTMPQFHLPHFSELHIPQFTHRQKERLVVGALGLIAALTVAVGTVWLFKGQPAPHHYQTLFSLAL
jgi:hypothetical protein